MDRGRNLDFLVKQEREKRERSEGRDVVPPSLSKAVERARSEIERVLDSNRKARLILKKEQ